MKYPIYIPSKGRPNGFTAKLLLDAKLDFFIVVEKQDFEAYKKLYGKRVLNLKGDNFGCVSHARNFIKAHAANSKAKYHWQIDDDIKGFMQVKNRETLSEDTDFILSSVDKFVDKYSNIGMAGLSSSVFGRLIPHAYKVNKFAYTAMLIRSDLPFNFVPGTEEDLDFNLQVLTNKLCTVQFSEFLFKWSTTGTKPGGYTEINKEGRRLQRQKATVRRWPQFYFEIEHKKDDLYRIVTNNVWKNFKHNLIPAKS